MAKQEQNKMLQLLDEYFKSTAQEQIEDDINRISALKTTGISADEYFLNFNSLYERKDVAGVEAYFNVHAKYKIVYRSGFSFNLAKIHVRKNILLASEKKGIEYNVWENKSEIGDNEVKIISSDTFNTV